MPESLDVLEKLLSLDLWDKYPEEEPDIHVDSLAGIPTIALMRKPNIDDPAKFSEWIINSIRSSHPELIID